MTYTLTSTTLANNAQAVIRDADRANIPPDPRNADFEQYLTWLGAGNTPSPVPAPSAAQAAQTQYSTALGAGLSVTWSTSAALNGTYALGVDPVTQAPVVSLISAEIATILANGTFSNGQPTRNWPNSAGSFQTFTIVQFKAMATAIALYLDQLATALAAASAGRSATWPSANVTIDA